MEKYHLVFKYIYLGQLKEAFDVMGQMAEICRNNDLKIQLEKAFDTYRNILRYSFELGDDPEKEKVYQKLIKSLTELADDIREDIITGLGLLNYHRLKSKIQSSNHFTNHESDEMVEKLEFEREVQQILGVRNMGKVTTRQVSDNYETSLGNIFEYIWLKDKFGEAEIRLLNKIRKTKSIPWYDKCILVSSLTLSLIRHFDRNKIMLLIDFYNDGENQVWQRALAGWIIGLHAYDKRLKYYPEILDRLTSMQGDRLLIESMEMIVIQFIKAKETEKITKKIRDEILPEVLKIKSKLEEKLDLDNITSFTSFEEKNPEWENFFKDSPDVYQKFEEFSNMQLDGADVFLSAFAMLKQFDFFNKLSNWFLPFYRENELVKNSLETISDNLDVGLFTEGLEKTSFMCNSDKYSFCLNVKHLPPPQKSMMTELFNMELKAMNEMKEEDELINASAANKAIITQYFQDLYRFYKLHPWRNDFDDIFNLDLEIYNAGFFQILVEDSSILRNIGEFFFENSYFSKALSIFLKCQVKKNDNHELFEKTAFCYQQTGDFQKALEFYHKAEYLEKNKKWLYNKIALCYRKTRDHKKAVEYYLEAEKLDPDNMQIQALLGQTYMELEEYETALKYYFKVEYHKPDNHRIHRPIAWCYFILGQLENARKYLAKTISKDGNKNDYLNMGHIEWCLGNKKAAIENYRQSVKESNDDYEWFSRILDEDKKYLIKNGIHQFDIVLMPDYLKLSGSYQ
ncbi:MAG: tetratricopeptide repeat protein [Bacteroidales bacterium]|nr:tetratricopeptide repeat protein [Bacteroidales bacterium]